MHHIKYIFTFGIGGCITVLGALEYIRRTIHTGILDHSIAGMEGRRIFYTNRTAKDILGIPIKEYPIDTWDGALNFDNDYECQLHVPVEGTKLKGYIFAKGIKNLRSGDWTLTGVSLKSEDLSTTLYSILPPEDKK